MEMEKKTHTIELAVFAEALRSATWHDCRKVKDEKRWEKGGDED